MKNFLRTRGYFNFQNLTFLGLIILSYQNYETRNKLNDIVSRLEYTSFEIEEIKKETREATKYAKSANTMAFSFSPLLRKKNKFLLNEINIYTFFPIYK